jgi:long-chain acyl-CoA synthetase
VSGVDRLARLEGPVIFVSNHASHFDTPTMLRALPDVWRRRVAVAAAEDYFFRNAALGTAVALVFNAFPFSRTGSVRATLDHCAWLMDRGWSILLFPEGTRSITGEMTDFKSGVGLLAVELETPVVPVWIHGTASVLPKGRVLPRRGHVTVRFGEAVHFTHDTPPAGAAAAIESSVRRLAASDRGRTVRGFSR